MMAYTWDRLWGHCIPEVEVEVVDLQVEPKQAFLGETPRGG